MMLLDVPELLHGHTVLLVLVDNPLSPLYGKKAFDEWHAVCLNRPYTMGSSVAVDASFNLATREPLVEDEIDEPIHRPFGLLIRVYR